MNLVESLPQELAILSEDDHNLLPHVGLIVENFHGHPFLAMPQKLNRTDLVRPMWSHIRHLMRGLPVFGSMTQNTSFFLH